MGKTTLDALVVVLGFRLSFSKRARFLCTVLCWNMYSSVYDGPLTLFSSLSESCIGISDWQKSHMTHLELLGSLEMHLLVFYPLKACQCPSVRDHYEHD